jgi:hypothetical protein
VRAAEEAWDIEIGICLFRARVRMTNAAESFWSVVQKREIASLKD